MQQQQQREPESMETSSSFSSDEGKNGGRMSACCYRLNTASQKTVRVIVIGTMLSVAHLFGLLISGEILTEMPFKK
jgi:hypothetical protein